MSVRIRNLGRIGGVITAGGIEAAAWLGLLQGVPSGCLAMRFGKRPLPHRPLTLNRRRMGPDSGADGFFRSYLCMAEAVVGELGAGKVGSGSGGGTEMPNFVRAGVHAHAPSLTRVVAPGPPP